jgi:hypothetical protein
LLPTPHHHLPSGRLGLFTDIFNTKQYKGYFLILTPNVTPPPKKKKKKKKERKEEERKERERKEKEKICL